MANKTSDYSIEASNIAEGKPDDHEALEPIARYQTSTVARVHDTIGSPTGETGVIAVVKLPSEGRDRIDAQDASLTKGETRLEAERATDRERRMSSNTAPILIVEDTLELGEVIQATLEGMGLQSYHETHGKNGLERMKTIQPRLVLLDIGLPDISGWKMLDHIKEHYLARREPMPPIIIITAYGDPANRVIGKLQNIHSYLVKPFTPDQVEQVVSMALRGERPDDPNIGGIPSATG